MPHDPGMADQMREDIGVRPGPAEKRMFGGLCFLLHGTMIGGVGGRGTLHRVGKEREAEALKLDGVTPMIHGGHKMGGVRLCDAGFADDMLRARITEMAPTFTASLPPKATT